MQGFFSTGTSAGLASAILQVSNFIYSNPAWLTFAYSATTPAIMLEADVTAADLVQLASQQANGSNIIISTPLLMIGPLPEFPLQRGVPNPASVTLDLTGCVGCLSLASSKVHFYLSNLHLTGLMLPPAAAASFAPNSSSGGDSSGAALTLPLWAFQFVRVPGNASVHLYNVTLTLPREEFRLILALAGLPATTATGPGPATAAPAPGTGMHAGTGLLARLVLQVRPSWPLAGH